MLRAASRLFLEHGFEGTSCEQVAAEAKCGKASIYARYADKRELFEAVIDFKTATDFAVVAKPAPGLAANDRVVALASGLIEQSLQPEAVAMMRLMIAEATRFPALASRANALARGRAVDLLAAEISRATAKKLIDFVFAPLQLRALLGEDLARLRASVRRDVREAVSMLLRPPLR